MAVQWCLTLICLCLCHTVKGQQLLKQMYSDSIATAINSFLKCVSI